MPPYIPPAVNPNVQQAVPGLVSYLWGSFNDDVAPTRMTVTSVQLTSPTAQVTGIVIEGQIPTVGQLVSIRGAVPSYFNVTNAKITAVSASANPDAGVYTISFALTNSNIPTTNSPGLAIAPQVEIGEAVVAGASQQAALQANVNPAQGRSIRFDTSFPVSQGSVLVVAQSADLDIDSEYQDLGPIAQLTGGVLASGLTTSSVIFTGITAGFVRAINRNLAGVGAARIVTKVLV